MDAETQARELLAEELDRSSPTLADQIRAGNEQRNGVASAALRAIVRALSPPASEAVVPEGWVLVPKEVTPEMQRAYFNSIDLHMDRVQTSATFGRHDNMALAYRKMLAATPSPPVGEKGEG